MIEGREIIRLALVSSLILSVGCVSRPYAAASVTLDVLEEDVVRTSIGPADVGNLKPLAGHSREAVNPPPRGNPLWPVPLSDPTATRERPIFSRSRRPPPLAVASRIEPVILPVAQKDPEPEHPSLALIGSVVGDGNAIAVFLDRTTQGVVRLRPGEAHAGWVLSSILQREVTLRKADQVEVLLLQRANGLVDIPVNPGIPIISGRAGS